VAAATATDTAMATAMDELNAEAKETVATAMETAMATTTKIKQQST